MVTRFLTGDDGSCPTVDRIGIDHFEELLLEQRQFRIEQLRALDTAPVGAGSPLAEINATLRTGASSALAEVEAALQRIEQGGYGRCVRCQQPIATERLEILPMAARCMPCQRAGDAEAAR